MILSDIGKTPESVLKQINRHLNENYGFVITETETPDSLDSIAEKIHDEIYALKLGGGTAQSSPEIAQRLLILEGIRVLRESFKSPDYDTLIDQMADCVVDYLRRTSAEDSQENFEDALKDAMRIYRSSEYQFPDYTVENAIRSAAISKLGHTPSQPMDMMSQHYGSDAQFPIDAELDNLTQDTEDMSIFEKKNMVNRLRTLLETQVSQAEVMMAAKGFAQGLQEMVEKVGRLQNEDLPPVTDQMRETYDTESASAFQTLVYSAMQNVMDALYTAKNQIDDAVENMATTGQVGASTDMDKDLGDMEPADELDTDLANVDADLDDAEMDLDNIEEPEDDFGAAEQEEPLGRTPKMESVESLKRRVAEMRHLVETARRLK